MKEMPRYKFIKKSMWDKEEHITPTIRILIKYTFKEQALYAGFISLPLRRVYERNSRT